MDWVVPAAILVAAPNANPAASAQSLFEGVPPIVRSCHEFNSRDWSAAGTASFLKRISCAEPNKVRAGFGSTPPAARVYPYV